MLNLVLVNLQLSLLKSDTSNFNGPVSIVIAARNESDNLRKFLPKILEQEYPLFEVIVVNDRSIDDSVDILRAYEQRYSNLKVASILESEKFNFNKKFALTIGIKAAQNEHILLTDADCEPISRHWLSEMSKGFGKERIIVIGYGGYFKANGILNKIIRSETFLIAQQYFGFGKLGLPYMAVGRNLAYSKELFIKNKGFSKHQYLSSGDDDLFIAENANKRNTSFVFGTKSYTQSVPKKTWHAYLEQKRRHLTSSGRYAAVTKIVLGISSLSNYLFYGVVTVCLFYPAVNIIAVESILLIIVTQVLVSYKSLKTLGSLDLLPWIFIADIFILLFYPFAFAYNFLQSGSLWKNY